MSSDQGAPGWLGDTGDEKPPSCIGIISNANISIPIHQPVFHGVSLVGFVCSARSCFPSRGVEWSQPAATPFLCRACPYDFSWRSATCCGGRSRHGQLGPNWPKLYTASLNSSCDGKCITWKWRMGPFKTSSNLPPLFNCYGSKCTKM